MKTKLWLIQIVMVAIVSLVFSAPVFADPGNGVVQKNANANGKAKAIANVNAGFSSSVVVGEEEEPNQDPVSCPDGFLDVNGDGSECIPLSF